MFKLVFTTLFKILLFVVGAGLIALGVLMLNETGILDKNPAGYRSKADSTISETREIDSSKTVAPVTKSVQNIKTVVSIKDSACSDCIKADYDNGYKFILLGVVLLLLLFLLPLLKDFNILGIFSASFRDRVDTLKAQSNQAEQAGAQPASGAKPVLSSAAVHAFTELGGSKTDKRIAKYETDPRKGKWGGKSEVGARRITAVASIMDNSGPKYKVLLTVISTDVNKPLTGYVIFHLLPDFINADPRIFVRDGIASLEIKAWGAFTVGAETDEGLTKLEIDLSTAEDAASTFITT